MNTDRRGAQKIGKVPFAVVCGTMFIALLVAVLLGMVSLIGIKFLKMPVHDVWMHWLIFYPIASSLCIMYVAICGYGFGLEMWKASMPEPPEQFTAFDNFIFYVSKLGGSWKGPLLLIILLYLNM